MCKTVEVVTGSRLHFGMFSFGHPGTRQFGGVGAMIEAPTVRVRISPADSLQTGGALGPRVMEVARRVSRHWGEAGVLPCAIEVASVSRAHVGLGSGTQLALAVARGLHAFFDRHCDNAEELARSAGRGRRSAIGLHGFCHGGMILEGGKLRSEEISPLLARLDLPAEWRWVLICPRQSSGLSGAAEEVAFEKLPPTPHELTAELCREAILELLPAAASADFDAFSRSLFRFGQWAGECFAAFQAGAYATPQTAQLVADLRRSGVEGVGQSSWGPTVFALVKRHADADDLAGRLRTAQPDCEVNIAQTMNTGARVAISTDLESSPSSQPRASRGP